MNLGVLHKHNTDMFIKIMYFNQRTIDEEKIVCYDDFSVIYGSAF